MEIVIDNKSLENFYCYPCQFCKIFHMVFRFPVFLNSIEPFQFQPRSCSSDDKLLSFILFIHSITLSLSSTFK